MLRDITEELRAKKVLEDLTTDLERQVAERTSERDGMWRLSPDLLAVIGFDGRLRRLNPAWSAMLGYEGDSLTGSKFELLLPMEDRRAVGEHLAEVSGGRKTGRFENRIRQFDGEWRWIAWTAAPELDAIYVVGRDVTAERLSAQALADRNKELARQIDERERVEGTLRQMQRLEAVGQLTAGVAHDFNNLLTVVLGNIGFVERRLASPDAEKDIRVRLGHMKTAAERGATLTAQLLAFSRRQKLEPEPVDLNQMVAGMRGLLQGTMGGAIRIETVLKPDLASALVDPTQIEMIILNLAINARDAMEIGGALTLETGHCAVTEEALRPEDPAPGDYVTLTVSDTGTGIPPEIIGRVFEPFFTTKGVGKGSGLGLAQVFGFAKQSGGGVRIRTAAGEGTSLTVFLPRATQNRVVVEKPSPLAPLLSQGAKKTVLLVDDDSAVREVILAMVEELGFEVIGVGSGSAALDIIGTSRPIDVLIVDYAMPGSSGTEVAKKARELRSSLPILFATGYADLKALEEIGQHQLIRKPFQEDELAAKLATAIDMPVAAKVVSLRPRGSGSSGGGT